MKDQNDFLFWQVPSNYTGFPDKVMTIVVESLAGKRRIFVPGRRCSPYQVAQYHKKILGYCLKAILKIGWKISPKKLVGAPILTEGLGAPFFDAFHCVFPNQKMGGAITVWAKREKVEEIKNNGKRAVFRAKVIRIDTTALEYLGGRGILLLFDIGATGSTLEAVIPEVLQFNQIERIIFASPCTSLEAAQVFIEKAVENGIQPKNLAVIANEGLFGLDQETGTFLSFQLPGTITSKGNKQLSKTIYSYPRFCHIGAGGFAANCQAAYEEELREDEASLGKIERFDSFEQAMNHANLIWPYNFGSPF